MISRAALNQFCKAYCNGNPQMVATAEAAFYWFNKSISSGAATPAFDSRPKLSKRQQELLDFMKEYQREHGSFPTYAEMAEHLLVTSQNTVTCMLTAMEGKGYIEKRRGKSRGYKIKESA